MNHDCTIALFGGLSVRVGSRHIIKFRTRNAAFLLARLALEPQFHQREALIEWLWPDCELAVGRNRLSVTLSELRRTLGDTSEDKSLVVATHDAVRLDSVRVTTDVATWETLLSNASIVAPNEAAAALRAALVTFGGWLLVGCDDDHFARHERRQNAAFCEAVCRLASLTARGDAFVLAQLRRAATFAPHNEAVTRALMQALGDEDALRHYAAFEHLVRDENGATPNLQTRQIARQIQLRHARRNSDKPLVANAVTNALGNGGLPVPNNRFFGRDAETNN